MKEVGIKIITNNKKAHFNYFLSDFLECGLELYGTEIKSLRVNGCGLNDSYVIFKNNEAFILNMNIAPYKEGNIFNKDPLRTKKLLLHKKEIIKLQTKVKVEGYTIVPTKVYFKDGLAKVEIALGTGKKLYDKREDMKEKDHKDEMDKARKEKNNE
jgi:SsrA-binding protein